MTKEDRKTNSPVPVIIGEKIPGLLNASELPEGQNYRDQVIESSLGKLSYDEFQLRDGYTRWCSENGHYIKVNIFSGKVVEITKPENKQ